MNPKKAPATSTARSAADLPALNTIVCGDAAQELGTIPEEVIDCIVTSPPYFRQRNYDVAGQLGIETTPAEYVQGLMRILAECRRVLKPTGTMWLNVGDKYGGGRLLGIPWRVAIAMQDAGWILRSDIIWHKTNAMPHPTRSRPTTDHEYMFLFSKTGSYYYDADAIREPHVTFSDKSKMKGGRNHFGKAGGTPEQGKNGGNTNLHDGRWDQAFHPLGRNKRTVWSIPLGKFRGAHFAVFPEQLVEPCIRAGSPPGGIVLDPFCGAGTVAAVASRLRRNFLGIELNEHYVRLAQKRLQDARPGRPAVTGQTKTSKALSSGRRQDMGARLRSDRE
jgi:site-specific DNA-methyltransferase (adenine-specific)